MSDRWVPSDILLVEDNPGDARLVKELFAEEGLAENIYVATDGGEALDILHRRNGHSDVPRPDIILLDWHLPRMEGEEILDEVKADEDLKDIPVVVLSGSKAQVDVLKEEAPRADEYLTKPIQPDEFLAIIEDL